MLKKPKLLVILGPTASGKSDLAVLIAKQWSGEVISADSRQIYRGLNVGSGKVPLSPVPEGTDAKVSTEHPTSSERCLVTPSGYYGGIPHHLLDVAEPTESFSVVNFKKQATTAINNIIARGKLPIITGGTGMYISSIIDDTTFPTVPDNEKLREELSKKTTEELFVILQEKDPERASTIERDNPRRLIRALEIIEHLGKVPKQDITPPSDYAKSPYDMLQIGLSVPKEQLKKNIHARTIARMEKGFVEEVAELIEGGITLERMREFGLGYRCISEILAKTSNQEDTSCSILQNSKITSEEIKKMSECIENSEWRYAKRQMTWFKRDSRIEWFAPEEKERIFKRIVSFMV